MACSADITCGPFSGRQSILLPGIEPLNMDFVFDLTGSIAHRRTSSAGAPLFLCPIDQLIHLRGGWQSQSSKGTAVRPRFGTCDSPETILKYARPHTCGHTDGLPVNLDDRELSKSLGIQLIC